MQAISMLLVVGLVVLAPPFCGTASLLPINTEAVRRSVVFLFAADAKGEANSKGETATAFLIEIPLKSEPKKFYYALVTARHVVDPVWACEGAINPTILYARVNKKKFDPDHDESGVEYIRVALREGNRRVWAVHQNETVDAAVIPIDSDKFLVHDVATIRISDFGTPDEIKSVGIGDDVVSAGLVPGFSGQKRNYPFFKFGKVSNIPEEPTMMPCRSGPARPRTFWYLAATLIGGNSGSPIFLLPPGNAIMRYGDTRPFLLGLQSISVPAGEIAGMTPAQYIYEIIEQLHLPDANLSRGLLPQQPNQPKQPAIPK